MRAVLSIVVPTLNAGSTLVPCLTALMEGVEAGLISELVISDGGSEDETLRIADEAGAEVVYGAASRGGQITRGVDVARGQWVLILHADTVLAEGWSRAVLRHIAETPDKAAFFRLAFDVSGMAPRFVAGWANIRARLFGLPFGDQGLLIAADTLAGIGGYPDMPLMEDVAVAGKLRGRLVTLPFIARTGATKYVSEGWLRRGARNLLTQIRYLLGVSPERLARGYRQSDRRP